MNATQYREALAALGLTQNGAARFTGVAGITGRRWAADGPPASVGKLLNLMVALNLKPEKVDMILAEPRVRYDLHRARGRR